MLGGWPEALTAPTGFAAGGYRWPRFALRNASAFSADRRSRIGLPVALDARQLARGPNRPHRLRSGGYGS